MSREPSDLEIREYSVLFVCTANVCRSPLAAELFRHLIQRMNGTCEIWSIESAGIWATPGQPAANEVQAVLWELGIDISDHRSRLVSKNILKRFSLVLTMEPGQKEALMIEYPELKQRIYMLSEMAGVEITIRDPIGGTMNDFKQAADEIERWLREGEDRIRQLAYCSLNDD